MELFEEKSNRRRKKIFCQMAEMFPFRTPDQCRTHHQKFEKQSGQNIQNLLKIVEEKIHKQLTNRDSEQIFRPYKILEKRTNKVLPILKPNEESFQMLFEMGERCLNISISINLLVIEPW